MTMGDMNPGIVPTVIAIPCSTPEYCGAKSMLLSKNPPMIANSLAA